MLSNHRVFVAATDPRLKQLGAMAFLLQQNASHTACKSSLSDILTNEN